MKQLRSSVCSIALAFIGVFAMAQTPTGSIQGLVTDNTGAVVTGATVTITRAATGEQRSQHNAIVQPFSRLPRPEYIPFEHVNKPRLAHNGTRKAHEPKRSRPNHSPYLALAYR